MSLRCATVSFLILAAAGSVHAEGAGDPDQGKELFRNCLGCHQLTSPEGDAIRKGGRAGPNLYGIVGQPAAATDENYRFSAGLKALNESGLTWDEASLTAFITNPNVYLKETLGAGHRSKMPFALPKGAADIAAYLAEFN